MNYNISKLTEVIQECGKHLSVLSRKSIDMNLFFPLTVEKYENLTTDEMDTIDIFLFRFAKLQDVMGSKLFHATLSVVGEDLNGLTFIDKLSLLDKFQITNSEEWMPIRGIRNDVAHEYPQTPQITVDALNSAYQVLPTLYEIIKKDIAFINRSGVASFNLPYFKDYKC